MKVYFGAPIRGKNTFEENYKKIFNEIKKMGYSLIDDEIITIPPDKFFSQLNKGGDKSNSELYEKNIELINKADINVFECSFRSTTVGFMINQSLEFRKPTIILYLKEFLPHFFLGIKHDKLIANEYDDQNLNTVIKKCLIKAQNLRDKRFNMFMSDELLRYLDDAANREGVNKSTFIRNLLLSHQKKSQKL